MGNLASVIDQKLTPEDALYIRIDNPWHYVPTKGGLFVRRQYSDVSDLLAELAYVSVRHLADQGNLHKVEGLEHITTMLVGEVARRQQYAPDTTVLSFTQGERDA